MTLKELSQLYYLNREIEMDQQQLEELRSKAESAAAAPLSHTPRSTTISSKVERYVAEIVDLTAIVAAKQQQCIHERNRLMRYITDIDDSLIRQIFTLRFVNGLPWDEVAESIGLGLTAAYARNSCYKHLNKDGRKKMHKMQMDVL